MLLTCTLWVDRRRALAKPMQIESIPWTGALGVGGALRYD
jgi:hypothetical protein